MIPILVALATFVSTLLGGLTAYRHRERLHLIISFSAGVLIAVIFFDILPEIFDLTSAHNLSPLPALSAIVIGFLIIHTLEKFAVIHNAHEEEYASHRHPMVGVVGASTLAIHSFLDGVGIGLGFHVSFGVGVAISLAILAHDFCDGINAVTLMHINKNKPSRTFSFLFLVALAPVLGAASTLIFNIPANVLLIYLGTFAGVLLYISAGDLLPEAHSKHSSFGMIGLTVFGAALIFVITRFI